MGVELPLHVVVTILECCVMFSGVKLSIRSFVLFWMSRKTSLSPFSSAAALIDSSEEERVNLCDTCSLPCIFSFLICRNSSGQGIVDLRLKAQLKNVAFFVLHFLHHRKIFVLTVK